MDDDSREDAEGQPAARSEAELSLGAAEDDAFAQEVGAFEADEDLYDEESAGRVETVDEQGRRHVRLAAPEGTEEILDREAPRTTGLPDWAERWRVRSATGTVLTAVAFGLQQVFETERKEPAIIMETSGEPPSDLPVEAQLEQLGPRQSSVTVRPWLLGSGDQAPAAGGEQAGQSEAQAGWDRSGADRGDDEGRGRARSKGRASGSDEDRGLGEAAGR